MTVRRRCRPSADTEGEGAGPSAHRGLSVRCPPSPCVLWFSRHCSAVAPCLARYRACSEACLASFAVCPASSGTFWGRPRGRPQKVPLLAGQTAKEARQASEHARYLAKHGATAEQCLENHSTQGEGGHLTLRPRCALGPAPSPSVSADGLHLRRTVTLSGGQWAAPSP